MYQIQGCQFSRQKEGYCDENYDNFWEFAFLLIYNFSPTYHLFLSYFQQEKYNKENSLMSTFALNWTECFRRLP